MTLLAAETFSDFFRGALAPVLLGTALLGIVSGALGTFAVLRRQSLVGDAVSHAAFPGLALAFLVPYLLAVALDAAGAEVAGLRLFGAHPLVLVAGGALSGWVALVLVAQVVRNTRVPFDAALGGALAVFFGFGLVLMTYLQKHVPASGTVGLERYLFGQAATMSAADVWSIAGIGSLALGTAVVFWKELKLLVFDPDYAATQGYRVGLLDLLLTTLLVLAIVVGLRAVGVVLMSAMVVAPAAAARQWSDRFGRVVALAGFLGGLAGVSGTLLSHVLSSPGRAVPTGPTIVLCATAVVVASILFAPRRGLAWRRAARGVTLEAPAAPTPRP
jgi:manganese/zinc/iron transport system permease protein